MGSSTRAVNQSILLTISIVAFCLMGACTDRPGSSSLMITDSNLVDLEVGTNGYASEGTISVLSPKQSRNLLGQRFALTLVVEPPGAGFVAIIPPFGPYKDGTVVTLSVIPPPVYPYAFSHWGGNASGTARTATVIMGSNKNVVANFVNPSVTPSPPAHIE